MFTSTFNSILETSSYPARDPRTQLHFTRSHHDIEKFLNVDQHNFWTDVDDTPVYIPVHVSAESFHNIRNFRINLTTLKPSTKTQQYCSSFKVNSSLRQGDTQDILMAEKLLNTLGLLIKTNDQNNK